MLRGAVSIYINNVISDSIEDEDQDTAEKAKQASLYNEEGELDRAKLGNRVGNYGEWMR